MTIYSFDVSLPNFEPACGSKTIAFCPAYRFLRKQVRWSVIPISLRSFYSLLWSTLSKALAYVVHEAEVDVFFWHSLAFSVIQRMLAIWFLVPLPFLNPAWTSGSSQFTYCWSLAWRILSSTLLACEMSFLWNWNENWPFPVLWPLLSFPNLLAYWVQHLYSIIF